MVKVTRPRWVVLKINTVEACPTIQSSRSTSTERGPNLIPIPDTPKVGAVIIRQFFLRCVRSAVIFAQRHQIAPTIRMTSTQAATISSAVISNRQVSKAKSDSTAADI